MDVNFKKQFCEESANNKRFFESSKKDNHFLFDLCEYVKHRLIKQGITHISSVDIDTYQDEARFYSYRRSTHKKESDYGCHLSCIYLEK